jgi:hypothetical protein
MGILAQETGDGGVAVRCPLRRRAALERMGVYPEAGMFRS